jgi:hypothetical protein
VVLALWAATLPFSTSSATARADDVASEYRLTAFPTYPLGKTLTGFGYVGWVYKPDGNYDSVYLGTGTFIRPSEAVQLWGGLISVYTNSFDKSNTLELRPFVGVKFMGANSRKIRYYNWTRYELRLTDSLDTGDWTTVHRIRNQTRLEVPLASAEKAWTPKSWYLLADVEPIWRSDTGQIDPLRLRAGVGHVASKRLLVEFQYYAQYTRPGEGGLEHTDNIFRLNLKIMTSKGVLSFLDGDFDD